MAMATGWLPVIASEQNARPGQARDVDCAAAPSGPRPSRASAPTTTVDTARRRTDGTSTFCSRESRRTPPGVQAAAIALEARRPADRRAGTRTVTMACPGSRSGRMPLLQPWGGASASTRSSDVGREQLDFERRLRAARAARGNRLVNVPAERVLAARLDHELQSTLGDLVDVALLTNHSMIVHTAGHSSSRRTNGRSMSDSRGAVPRLPPTQSW